MTTPYVSSDAAQSAPSVPANGIPNLEEIYILDTRWQPTSDYLIVRRLKTADKTSSGLFLPEAATQKASSGTVMRRGPNCQNPDIRLHDTVFWSLHDEYVLHLDDANEDVAVLRESSVILVRPPAGVLRP